MRPVSSLLWWEFQTICKFILNLAVSELRDTQLLEKLPKLGNFDSLQGDCRSHFHGMSPVVYMNLPCVYLYSAVLICVHVEIGQEHDYELGRSWYSKERADTIASAILFASTTTKSITIPQETSWEKSDPFAKEALRRIDCCLLCTKFCKLNFIHSICLIYIKSSNSHVFYSHRHNI